MRTSWLTISVMQAVIKIVRWSIFAVQLTLLISVNHVKDATCSVKTKPQNVLTKVGNKITFSCVSSTNTVTWSFTCTRCNQTSRVRQMLYDGNTIVLQRFAAFATVTETKINGLESSLTISLEDGSLEGIYTCMDEDTDTAYAHLTVTESPLSSCLSVSPRDVVVTVGESVILRAASSSKLRWYLTPKDLIFNGKSVSHAKFDERYDVITGNSNESHRADLVISDVRVSDAGRYIASNTKEHSEVEVNVVVLERPIECHVSSVAFRSLTLQCSFTYFGPLKPTITWNDEDITNSSLTQSATGGTVESSLVVSVLDVLNDNVPRWTATFPLSRCGEVIDQYEWSMNTENIGPITRFIGDLKQVFLIIVLAVASVTFIVILFCCIGLFCRRRSKVDTVKPPDEKVYARLNPDTMVRLPV